MREISTKTILKNTAALLCSAVFFVLASCEDKKTATKGKENKNFASQILYNSNIIQRDSGRVSLRFKAPVIEKYEYIDSPYVEAKKGFYLEYFDKKKPQIPGKIWADYAIYYEKKDFYKAQGHVKILTNDGTSFASKTIFWDRRKKKMYTSDTVHVMDSKGNTLIGANGMVANDDFSEYTFNNNTGSFPAKEIPAVGR
ncbi:LPS export ABC transporter periplasmic protein LptC [Daejeonia sp. YH14]|uniref:LPS export ABC transporter periplasmic protein LptC n=1 Tax=Daejeonia sp. YH14 TaxID=3439042 RepID=UPI003F49AD4F